MTLKNTGIWLAVFIAAVVAAPLLAFTWSALAGVYLTVISLLLLVELSIQFEEYRKLAISAALLPLAVMVNLSLPQSSPFAQAVVFYDTLLLLALIYRHIFTLGRPVASTSMTARGYMHILPIMIVAGLGLGLLGFWFLHNQYYFEGASTSLVAAMAIVFAIAEEMFFRGLVQQRAARIMHPVVAAGLTVVIATLASIGHTTPLVPLVALISNIVLSCIYFKKQNLLLTITVNAVSKLLYMGLLSTFVLI